MATNIPMTTNIRSAWHLCFEKKIFRRCGFDRISCFLRSLNRCLAIGPAAIWFILLMFTVPAHGQQQCNACVALAEYHALQTQKEGVEAGILDASNDTEHRQLGELLACLVYQLSCIQSAMDIIQIGTHTCNEDPPPVLCATCNLPTEICVCNICFGCNYSLSSCVCDPPCYLCNLPVS